MEHPHFRKVLIVNQLWTFDVQVVGLKNPQM